MPKIKTLKEFKHQVALGTLSSEMKKKLAYGKRTPKSILAILSRYNDRLVKIFIAGNPNTPKRVLNNLSNDWNKRVRFYLTQNIIYNKE